MIADQELGMGAETKPVVLHGVSLSFDQVSNRLITLGLDPADATGSDYVLLQLADSTTTDETEILGDLGVELVEEISPNTHIARFEGGDLRLVMDLAFVHWGVTYHPSFKLTPDLDKEIGGFSLDECLGVGSEPSPTLLNVAVRVHEDVDPSLARSAIAEAAGVDADCIAEEARCFRLAAERSRLATVARLDEVRSLERSVPRGQSRGS